MTTKLTPQEMDHEIHKAISRIREINAGNKDKDQDALFTDTVAWAVIIALYVDTLEHCGDARSTDLFQSVARKTYDKVQAIMSDHGRDEAQAARGS
jgi:hypothetical protein